MALVTDIEFSESSYMFIIGEYVDGRKTPIFYISERGRSALGEIRWYGAWRAFCFFTYPDCIFDSGCLAKILEWVESVNAQWKRKKPITAAAGKGE